MHVPKLFPFVGGESRRPIYSDLADRTIDSEDEDANTVGSEGTLTSILRRRRRSSRQKRNTRRSVSWSETFETYEEGDLGVNLMDTNTFETLDTLEEMEGRQDVPSVTVFDQFMERIMYPNGDDSYDETFDIDTVRDTSVDEDEVERARRAGNRGRSKKKKEHRRNVSLEQLNLAPPPPHSPPEAPRQEGRKKLTLTTSAAAPPPPPLEVTPPRQKERKHLVPPPPPVDAAPKQEGRKQLSASQPTVVFDNLPLELQPLNNLAMCSSTLSDSTIELMRDRYGGLEGGEDNEENNELNLHAQAAGNVKKAVSFNEYEGPKKTQDARGHTQGGKVATTAMKEEKEDKSSSNIVAVIPKELELPEVLEAHSADGETLGSLSMEELTVDGNNGMEEAPSAADKHDDSFASFDENPSWDDQHTLAASDDESIVTLTRRDHEYKDQFVKQQKADSTAGHIGLILPFFDKLTNQIGAGLEGTTTMFDSWDMETLKNDLLRGIQHPSTSVLDKSKSAESGLASEAGMSVDGGDKNINNDAVDALKNDTSKTGDGGKDDERDDAIAASRSHDGSEGRKTPSPPVVDDQESKGKGGDVVLGSISYDGKAYLQISPNNGEVVTATTAAKKDIKSIEEHDIVDFDEGIINNNGKEADEVIATQSLMDKISSSEEGDDAPKEGEEVPTSKEEGEDVPSDASTEVNSDQLSSHEGSSDDKLLDEVPVGEVIPIQDIGKVAKKKSKLKQKKKDKKKYSSNDMSTLWMGNNTELPQEVIMNQGNSDAGSKRGMRSFYARNAILGRKKKQSTNTNPNNSGSSSGSLFSRFQPKLLPPGKVYDEDDDDEPSISSCMTTESILTELKVIEDTAKFMYHQLLLSEGEAGEVASLGPDNSVSALFTQEETELVLNNFEPTNGPYEQQLNMSEERERRGAVGWDSQNGGATTTTKKKKGKFRKFFRLPRRKSVSITWTPKQSEAQSCCE